VSRTPWFNEHNGELEFEVVSRMASWQTALADGVVTAEELSAQKESVARLLKQLDARVDDETHHLITSLLNEVSVLHAMQVFYASEEAM
jgi:hypothetical protein